MRGTLIPGVIHHLLAYPIHRRNRRCLLSNFPNEVTLTFDVYGVVQEARETLRRLVAQEESLWIYSNSRIYVLTLLLLPDTYDLSSNELNAGLLMPLLCPRVYWIRRSSCLDRRTYERWPTLYLRRIASGLKGSGSPWRCHSGEGWHLLHPQTGMRPLPKHLCKIAAGWMTK